MAAGPLQGHQGQVGDGHVKGGCPLYSLVHLGPRSEVYKYLKQIHLNKSEILILALLLYTKSTSGTGAILKMAAGPLQGHQGQVGYGHVQGRSPCYSLVHLGLRYEV